WMRAVKEAGLRALEAKAPGPKKIEPEKAPKEALNLRDRVARLEKELKAVRKDREHLNLVVATAQRIIRRNAWGTVPEPAPKKNGMRNLRRGSSMPENGPRNESTQRRPGSLPGAGESLGARTGDGSAGAGAPLPDEGS
ncbi:MAG: hypothetical protein ACRD5L_05570, partial [Bryobacteraceae bacterium]